ncbi:hypothetical protein KP509_01G002300 [Ceratopteris richardii]|uniref:Uncharacterized protein n=1 Tax=Ceratopteris richardii TaxID=49495 RepID=A0A8T2V9Z9_CERRI|nr:hypothetical protein KP509_01G002300 [Ceratopteris richardii]
MAGVSSDASTRSDWEVVSVTSSVLGLASTKPDESNAPAQDEAYGDHEGLAKLEDDSQVHAQPFSGEADEDVADVREEDPDKSNLTDYSPRKAMKTSWWKHDIFFGKPLAIKRDSALTIALAVAVVGMAIIGHQWYRQCKINQQLQLDLNAKEERLSDVMQQVKDAITGRRKVGVSRGSFFGY